METWEEQLDNCKERWDFGDRNGNEEPKKTYYSLNHKIPSSLHHKKTYNNELHHFSRNFQAISLFLMDIKLC